MLKQLCKDHLDTHNDLDDISQSTDPECPISISTLQPLVTPDEGLAMFIPNQIFAMVNINHKPKRLSNIYVYYLIDIG